MGNKPVEDKTQKTEKAKMRDHSMNYSSVVERQKAKKVVVIFYFLFLYERMI